MKIIFLFLIIPIFTLAQGIVVCTTTPNVPCTWEDFTNTILNLINTVVIVSFWVAFLVVSIGAFMMMLGGASEARYKQGRDLIWTAIWFYVLILASGIFFDIILEFFSPQFPTLILLRTVFAQTPDSTATLTPTTFYEPLRDILMSELRCGQDAEPIFESPALGRLFACIFEVIGLLKNTAVVLLVLAIIISAFYLIATPLFGLGNITKAYKILVWSIVGLVIILLADLIRAQIERLVE
jgi:hypothetical protein